MKLLVIKFEDGVDLSAFTPETPVDISSPNSVSGKVIANAVAADPQTLSGTYNITPVD